MSAALYPRILSSPKGSFFLLGPRGTGKSTWIRGTFPKEEAAIKLPEEKLRDKAGLYWNRETDDTVKVEVKEGKLVVLPGEDERLPAEPLSNTRFRLVAFPVVFEFRPGKEGSRPTLCVEGDDPQCLEPGEEFHPPAMELREYAGTYFSEEAEVFYRLAEEGGKLVQRRLRYKPKELKPQVRDVFSGDMTLRFVRDPGGKVTGLLASTSRARNIRFRKVSREGV